MTPNKSEGLTGTSGQPPRHTNADTADCAHGLAESPNVQTAQHAAALMAKRVATATAQAALRGIALHRIEADDGRPLFVATRDYLTASFTDISAVEAWLTQIGGIAQ